MARKVIGTKVRHAIVILLNGHDVKIASILWLLSIGLATLKLGYRCFFLQWVVRVRCRTGQSAQNKRLSVQP